MKKKKHVVRKEIPDDEFTAQLKSIIDKLTTDWASGEQVVPLKVVGKILRQNKKLAEGFKVVSTSERKAHRAAINARAREIRCRELLERVRMYLDHVHECEFRHESFKVDRKLLKDINRQLASQ